jgi:hypothetical protein
MVSFANSKPGEWSFSIGIVDKSRKRGVVRCSTFQMHVIYVLQYQPSMQTMVQYGHLLTSFDQRESKFAISYIPNTQSALHRHLPLSFPQPSSRPLTAWSTITLNLWSKMPHFSTLASMNQLDNGEGSRHDVNRPVTLSAANILFLVGHIRTCRTSKFMRYIIHKCHGSLCYMGLRWLM